MSQQIKAVNNVRPLLRLPRSILYPDILNLPLTATYDCAFGHTDKDMNELQPSCLKTGRCQRRGHLVWTENMRGMVTCAACAAGEEEDERLGFRDTVSCAVCAHMAHRRAGAQCDHCDNQIVPYNVEIRPSLKRVDLASKLQTVMCSDGMDQLTQIENTLEKYGHVECIAAYHHVVFITRNGGMLTANGVRFRQALGLWWAVLKKTL